MPQNLVGGLIDRDQRAYAGEFMRGGNPQNRVILKQDFVVDQTLPRLYDDPFTKEAVVIPKGRILTIQQDPLTTTPATISICTAGGYPAGVAEIDYIRQSLYLMERDVPAPVRDQQITMPYVEAVNGADLVNGCLLMSDAQGRFVKWNGTTVDQVVGRLDILDKRTGNNRPGWLNWVTANFSDWGYGLLFDQNITVTVTNDGNTNTLSATNATMSWNGTTVTLGATPASSLKCDTSRKKFFFTKGRLNLTAREVDIYVGGSLLDKEGLYGGVNYGDGYNYMIDPQLGYVLFTSVIATTATVQATYAYEAEWVGGASYGQGIPGLTDGQVSGMGAGTPAWIDQVGAVGKMYISLRSF